MSQFLSMGDAQGGYRHEAISRPSGPVLKLSQSMTKQQFLDYASAGYHYAVDRYYSGESKTLWGPAVKAYMAAYALISTAFTPLSAYSRVLLADQLASAARVVAPVAKKVVPKATDSTIPTVDPMLTESPPPPGAKGPPLLALGVVGFGLWYFFGRKKGRK